MGLHRFEIVSKDNGLILDKYGRWWHEDENGIEGYFAMGLGDREEGAFAYGPFTSRDAAVESLIELRKYMQELMEEALDPVFVCLQCGQAKPLCNGLCANGEQCGGLCPDCHPF